MRLSSHNHLPQPVPRLLPFRLADESDANAHEPPSVPPLRLSSAPSSSGRPWGSQRSAAPAAASAAPPPRSTPAGLLRPEHTRRLVRCIACHSAADVGTMGFTSKAHWGAACQAMLSPPPSQRPRARLSTRRFTESLSGLRCRLRWAWPQAFAMQSTSSLRGARKASRRWRYNSLRPHSALRALPPLDAAQQGVAAGPQPPTLLWPGAIEGVTSRLNGQSSVLC